jgi:hypothetical protein
MDKEMIIGVYIIFYLIITIIAIVIAFYFLILGLIMLSFGILGLYYCASYFWEKYVFSEVDFLYWTIIAPLGWFLTAYFIFFGFGSSVDDFFNPNYIEVVLTIWLISSFVWYVIPIILLTFIERYKIITGKHYYNEIPNLENLIKEFVSTQLRDLKRDIENKNVLIKSLSYLIKERLNSKLDIFVKYLAEEGFTFTPFQKKLLIKDCLKTSEPLKIELRQFFQDFYKKERIRKEKEAQERKLKEKINMEKQLFDMEYHKTMQKEIVERICPNCKTKAEEDSIFCKYCGIKIELISKFISPEIKEKVWRRDRGQCVKCGKRENLIFKYIIPFSEDVSNTVSSIQLLCENCSRKKLDY